MILRVCLYLSELSGMGMASFYGIFCKIVYGVLDCVVYFVSISPTAGLKYIFF